MSASVGLESQDILNLLRVPGRPGLFVLSPFEHPVNIMSQQVRATNLVHAIDDANRRRIRRPSSKLRFAIIGGGVAGCTAAAYALLLGHEVTLFEAKGSLFHTLIGGTRHLDPTVYDWPDQGWLRPEVAVPVLRWMPSEAGQLANDLQNQMDSWQFLYGDDLKVHTHAHVYADEITSAGNRLAMRWRQHTDTLIHEDQYDEIVLAVGFGPERHPGREFPNYRSYWTENFEWINNSESASILTIGTGDGASADLIQTCLRWPNQYSLRDLMHKTIHSNSTLFDAVVSLENEARLMSPSIAAHRLTEGYTAANRAFADLDERLAEMMRSDLSITQVGRERHQLSPKLYPLNRLLMGRIIFLYGERFKYLSGNSDVWPLMSGIAARLPQPIADKDSEQDRSQYFPVSTFDHLIYRGGPEFALERAYPKVFAQMQDVQAATRLGLSRRALWTRRSSVAFFDCLQTSGGTKLRMYSDLFDPPVQVQMVNRVPGTVAEALFLGRVRLYSLLYDRIVLTDVQLIDGCVLGGIELNNIRSILPQIELKFRHRDIFEILRQLCSGKVLLSSVPNERDRKTLANLVMYENSPNQLLTEMYRSSSKDILSLADRLQRWSNLITNSDFSLAIATWKVSGEPTAVEHADPGRFGAELGSSAAKMFGEIFHNRASPRSQVMPKLDTETHEPKGDLIAIRNWYNRAYNRAIAQKLDCNVIESVWIGGSNSWDASAFSGTRGQTQKGDCLAWPLAQITDSEFETLKAHVSEWRLEWLLGRRSTSDFLSEIRRQTPQMSMEPQGAVVDGDFKDWFAPFWSVSFEEVPPHFGRNQHSTRFTLTEWSGMSEPDVPVAVTHFTRGLSEDLTSAPS